MSWLDRFLCPLAMAAEQAGPVLVITVLVGGAALVMLVTMVQRLFKAMPAGSGTPGPFRVAAALSSLGIYVVCRGADPLLRTGLSRPDDIDAARFAEIGWFEWKLLGRWAAPVLPLEAHPATGIALHAAVWIAITLLLVGLFRFFYRHRRLDWNAPERDLPLWYRWAGATTARRADLRFRRWAAWLVLAVVPVHVTAGFLTATESETARAGDSTTFVCIEELAPVAASVGPLPERPDDHPSPGTWVLTGLLLLALFVHFIREGKAPETKVEEKKEEEEPLPPVGPPPDPLRKLGDAVQSVSPGAFLESLERHGPTPAEMTELPEVIGPLVREAFGTLTRETAPVAAPDETDKDKKPEEAVPGEEASEAPSEARPWTHQREVLEHLATVWRMAAPAKPGASPVLREELGPSPTKRAAATTPHALVLTPEGAGRTTVTFLAALHVYLDRGATTLVVARDREAAAAWAARLRDGLSRSSTRWNVDVVEAGRVTRGGPPGGDELAAALLADRTPAIVVGDIEALEAEVLADPRTDPFFARLGLIIADDVDRFTGVAEMHLHMAMRRVWALLDRLHEAPYPIALLATAGPSANGMEAWARHVLAAPMRIFERDGAPRLTRVLLRRRDLVSPAGEDLPLSLLAEACDKASIPWHLRLCGDAQRGLRRAEIDLGALRRHHVEDPALAEVVLLEGTYPDVRREAERLAHAGVRSGERSVVLVLAPPADEEMVLHEEAEDAPLRELVRSLPRAVTLSEPDVVRQRHLWRALGREQDVAALRERLGERAVDELLERLRVAGRIVFREVYYLDPRTDDAATRRLVRSATGSALGEPIDAETVGESTDRASVVDRGTSLALRTVDRAIGPALYPPGRIFLHPLGRYAVLAGEDAGVIPVEEAIEPCRTTADRTVTVDLGGNPPVLSERELGGAPIRVALARAQVTERPTGVRRYGPGPSLLEHRTYERPVAASYATDLCLVAAGSGAVAPSREALVPLAAAVRMMLPCYLRASHDLVDVDLVEVSGERTLALFDRTPGASGFTRFLHQQGLGDLLRLARAALERLVGPELVRLRCIHDTTPDLRPEAWQAREALEWLDRVLDPPAGQTPREAAMRPTGPRVEYAEGEGQPGDLGRLWVSSTGRVDDLVWTRHPFVAEREGKRLAVFLDVAVERGAIARAVRRAAEGGAPEGTGPLEPAKWGEVHRALFAAGTLDLAAIIDRLRRLTGPSYAECVLSLVAGIPTCPSPIPAAQRTPVAALMRRRADRDAKVLLAATLLGDGTRPEALLSPGGVLLRVTLGGRERAVDLSGKEPRDVDPPEDAKPVLLAGK